MLASQDLMDVIKIGRTALECDQIDDLRKEALKRLEEAFHVDRSNFFLSRQYPSPRLDLDHVISQGVEQKYLTLFRQHYYKMDPFLKTIDVPKAIVTTGSIISNKDLTRSEYFNDFLKPQSIYNQMVIYLRSRGQLLGCLALFRSEHERDFSHSEKAKGELIAAFLGGALERSIFTGKITKSEEIINSICQDLPYKGILVLDESLEPVYINEEAKKTISYLAEEKELWDNSVLPLPKELYIRCKQLTEDSKRIGETAANIAVNILNKSTGQAISVNLRMINYSKDSKMCLICMDKNESGMNLSKQLDKYWITRREREVINLICEGLKNSEIGEKLFISEYTVENHLRSIYEKMGVKNRINLARKVMQFTSQR
jgi:DNA-binding CsgD family transcriptional regulator